ncbi:hypothetical protein K2173_009030 [Erythroxylum novogranatense]|uniref:GPI ethanolamine phosphate transferase 3 n=1 Tax=Erythroxylum novogranatense TaxID=1862640 RepID=A0AAV8TT59_9ROSI|nr:hypothetical protein K2173_009030 [Erythroxylum novogranatense]
MEAIWRSRWCFWLITAIHLVALLIFIRGFLLTRTELPNSSHCSDVSQSPCFFSPTTTTSTSSSSSNSGDGCWTKPAIDRLVIIILDALRFDFVAPSTFFQEKKPWMDRLTVLQNLASTNGSSARIFKAIADPPTTSLQRLKGLTTGGLPTFIDVGNSFGAPAIIEDNFIQQMVLNGKRVVMMGDDTWVQLFPQHFNKSYPYPSFNVKDLHTVDDGCIEHLFPALFQEDWDVLIAHFLGVDHAGHIYGVDSLPMVEKLEQYNLILEKLIKILDGESSSGGLHENTFLLVMGDHGQTLNGDHGGGSAEEVETLMFGMSFKKSSYPLPSDFDTSSCALDLAGKKICISSIQQLDFAATMSVLLGVPFPFGSIGRVNLEMYALATGTWSVEGANMENFDNQAKWENWLHNYADVLCVNSWQVKRYIDAYSASSVIGFSSEDLLHISDLYDKAQDNWLQTAKNLLIHQNKSYDSPIHVLTKQIDTYFNFLTNVSDLARSKWTEFNLRMMGVGLGIMLASLFLMFLASQEVNKAGVTFFSLHGDSRISFESVFAFIIVAIRACSLLSNSYILEEGKVASFLLATTGIIKLRDSIRKKKMIFEAIVLLLLVTILRLTIEIGLIKQAATSLFMKASHSWVLGVVLGDPIWTFVSEIGPILALIFLIFLLCKTIGSIPGEGTLKYTIMGTILSYMLISVHWASESKIPVVAILLRGAGRNFIPRIVYFIGLGQLLLLIFGRYFDLDKAANWKSSLVLRIVAVLSSFSSTIIMLSGKQGSFVMLAFLIGGYCIVRLDSMEENAINPTVGLFTFNPLVVIQWNLLAVCLFFVTGHWCAFDGLRYGAAFIGFDEFILVRQAILLTLDTFGFSLILPVLGLPFLALGQYLWDHAGCKRSFLLTRLSQVIIFSLLIIINFKYKLIYCLLFINKLIVKLLYIYF